LGGVSGAGAAAGSEGVFRLPDVGARLELL